MDDKWPNWYLINSRALGHALETKSSFMLHRNTYIMSGWYAMAVDMDFVDKLWYNPIDQGQNFKTVCNQAIENWAVKVLAS